eukprot:NODE_364_length_10092_cov_0.435905.p7 type:complete len:130 gc:universal NODE_364_length_10092_cov_0.435905:6395-6006(-)
MSATWTAFLTDFLWLIVPELDVSLSSKLGVLLEALLLSGRSGRGGGLGFDFLSSNTPSNDRDLLMLESMLNPSPLGPFLLSSLNTLEFSNFLASSLVEFSFGRGGGTMFLSTFFGYGLDIGGFKYETEI